MAAHPLTGSASIAPESATSEGALGLEAIALLAASRSSATPWGFGTGRVADERWPCSARVMSGTSEPCLRARTSAAVLWTSGAASTRRVVMAYYLVRAWPRHELLPDLESGLRAGAFRALSRSAGRSRPACATPGWRRTGAPAGRRRTIAGRRWRKSAPPSWTVTSRISPSRRSSRVPAGGRSRRCRACFPPWPCPSRRALVRASSRSDGERTASTVTLAVQEAVVRWPVFEALERGAHGQASPSAVLLWQR